MILRIERGYEEANLPPKNFEFEIRVETDQRQIFRQIQKKLQAYKDERKGPTVLVIQSLIGNHKFFCIIRYHFQNRNNQVIFFISKYHRYPSSNLGHSRYQ